MISGTKEALKAAEVSYVLIFFASKVVELVDRATRETEPDDYSDSVPRVFNASDSPSGDFEAALSASGHGELLRVPELGTGEWSCNATDCLEKRVETFYRPIYIKIVQGTVSDAHIYRLWKARESLIIANAFEIPITASLMTKLEMAKYMRAFCFEGRLSDPHPPVTNGQVYNKMASTVKKLAAFVDPIYTPYAGKIVVEDLLETPVQDRKFPQGTCCIKHLHFQHGIRTPPKK